MSVEHSANTNAVQPAAASPSFLRRLARTPLVDLLRGRISGRMDARHEAVRAELPAALSLLVVRTAHGTRLRHQEQHDIAEELVGWLQDDLAAGESVEAVAQRMGEPSTVARLLRWSWLQRRSRPRRVMRRVLQVSAAALAGVALTYVFFVVRYVTARPTIAHDYLAEMNREAKDIPSQRRAWPLYRRALEKLEPFPDDDRELNEQAYLHDWPQIAAYLQRNRPAFELARLAADKPRMGLWFGDPEDERWLRQIYGNHAPADPRQSPLLTLPTPQLDELARLRRLLLADCRRAVTAGEADVFLSNLQTLLGMAGHLRDGTPTVMTELRAFACFGTSLQLTGMLLDEHPALLGDEQLVDLAHRIATFSGGGTLRARLDGEHMLFEDLLQRIYTDNGAEDGRLTQEGHRIWRRIQEDEPPWDGSPLSDWDRAELSFSGTLLSLATASRQDVSYMADRLVLRFQAERAGPLWQWQPSTAEEYVQQLLDSPIQRQRYWPVLYSFPGLRHVALRGEILTQQRDAILVAIGLHLYHRRHGQWPRHLDELTPFPLPSVPLDRFSGKLLCYRLVEGKPLVYSTGVDRDDDGGRAHRMGNELAERWEPWTKVVQPPRLVNDGFGKVIKLGKKFDWDWLLWPQPLARPQEDDTDGPMTE